MQETILPPPRPYSSAPLSFSTNSLGKAPRPASPWLSHSSAQSSCDANAPYHGSAGLVEAGSPPVCPSARRSSPPRRLLIVLAVDGFPLVELGSALRSRHIDHLLVLIGLGALLRARHSELAHLRTESRRRLIHHAMHRNRNHCDQQYHHRQIHPFLLLLLTVSLCPASGHHNEDHQQLDLFLLAPLLCSA